jgi:hypothetical protein
LNTNGEEILMQKLKLFDTLENKIALAGDIQLQDRLLEIVFLINDPAFEIDYDSTGVDSPSLFNRAHELWKHSCFEVFWSKPSQPEYWEFNIATNGRWNIYYFSSYRQPAPPIESFDYSLLSFNFSSNSFTAIIECKNPLTEIEAGLTAVIKTKMNQTLYFATQHSGKKPDFHLRESFQLKRSPSR